MNWRNLLLWALLLVINSYNANAQNQSSFLFSSIHQDKDGFMWIGALSALYRYDGSRVTKFLRDPSDTNSLTHNYAKSLTNSHIKNIYRKLNVHSRSELSAKYGKAF